jgi:hypothetical protein
VAGSEARDRLITKPSSFEELSFHATEILDSDTSWVFRTEGADGTDRSTFVKL